MSTIRIIAASEAQRRTALRLSLSAPSQTSTDLERSVNTFLDYSRALSLDGRHWLALRDDQPVAACTCLESPGRTAMLFLGADGRCETDMDTVCQLIRQVVAAETRREIRLIQVLLLPDDRRNFEALLRCGFVQLAELHYMEVELAGREVPAIETPSYDGFEWITYGPERHGAFAEVVQSTYSGSLDCRGLAGLRHIDDVLASHRAAGRFSPHRWLMLTGQKQGIGCILLGENPLRPALDVVYMGVHAQWRRRGLGRILLTRALAMARAEQFEAMTVAVDAVNKPARHLYESLGFEHTLSRRAMLAVAGPTSRFA